ncbi:MAG: COG4315 family predicted lipoprotein [Solirubrobacteraceae bacterium]
MTKPIRHGGRAGLALTLAGLVLVFALSAGAKLAAARASQRPLPVTVTATHSSRLHETILVASGSGRTLYHLVPESAHHILCIGACAKLWPPLLVKSAHPQLKAGSGVHGHLSIVRRPDGKLQVAFDGMPLYTFARDHRRGDVNGQGFGGVWFVLRTSHATTSSTGNPIPQHNGGDMDGDNNGAPSDGDGNQ